MDLQEGTVVVIHAFDDIPEHLFRISEVHEDCVGGYALAVPLRKTAVGARRSDASAIRPWCRPTRTTLTCRSLRGRALRRSFTRPAIRPSRRIFGGLRSAERDKTVICLEDPKVSLTIV